MYYVIINPSAHSGKSAHEWLALKSALDQQKITYILHKTTGEKDTTDYVRSITDQALYEKEQKNHDLIVLGGDGTLNCVMNGIDDVAHTTITYFPTGTSNDFARSLGYSKDKTQQYLALSKSKLSHKSNVGQVLFGNTNKTRRFNVSCGIGYDAAICVLANQTVAKSLFNRLGLGKLIYVSVALRQLRALKTVPCDIYLDDKEPIHIENFYFAATMQQPYEGGGFKFCPDADDQDGLLDICIAGNISKAYALTLFPLAAKGKHIGKKGVSYYQCKSARIVPSEPLYVHTDGEVCGMFPEITLSSLEESITYMLAPK